MKKLLVAGAALGLAGVFGCDGKPTWQAYEAGPVSLQFPCKPAPSAAVVKCSRSDGTEFVLATVEKTVTPDEELDQMRQYVQALPKSELIDGSGYPFKWRETRQFRKLDSWLYYRDGKEYTVSISYTTVETPPIAAEFFSKVKLK